MKQKFWNLYYSRVIKGVDYHRARLGMAKHQPVKMPEFTESWVCNYYLSAWKYADKIRSKSRRTAFLKAAKYLFFFTYELTKDLDRNIQQYAGEQAYQALTAHGLAPKSRVIDKIINLTY